MGNDEITRGVQDLWAEDEWRQRLAESSSKPLKIKLGLDPTAADIHLGHTLVINKLRQFQQAGHQVILVIGDFTARIGDPTGKNVTRKPLDDEDIARNAATYAAQIYKILDKDKTQVVYNSQWLDDLRAQDLLRLASTVTVAQMLERDDFQKRYSRQQAIALHEFLYPIIQAYDSVVLEADVEIGGTDQTFNLLMGRELQRHYQQKPQIVMTLPLLEGLDGEKKMSKSLGNYIGITEDPDSMFGKLMSISDDLMWRYFDLLSFRPASELEGLRQAVAAGKNPMQAKFELAEEIVARFHGDLAAKQAHSNFVARFKNDELPQDLQQQELVADGSDGLGIGYVLVRSGLAASTSEALRAIKQGAVKLDAQKISDPKLKIAIGTCCIVQIGKRRIAKVKIVAA